MIIDTYVHFYPKKFYRAFAMAKLPYLPASLAFEPTERPNFYDPDTRIKYMDKFAIDIEVISPVSPQLWIPPVPNRMEITKIANDAIFETVEKYPERLIGLAMVPFLTGEALDELDRAITDLGMKGVQIFSNIDGKPLDSREFTPFYEKMCRYDLPIFVHPANTPSYSWIDEYGLSGMIGWPFDTSLAMCRLVFGGVLQKYPSLKFVTHHCGGMIPYYGERLRTMAAQPEFGVKLDRDPIDYFKMMYGDLQVMGSLPTFRCALSFFGPDHIVFATDYPYGAENGELATRQALSAMQEIDIPEEHKKMIYEGNARKLLKI